MKQKNITALIPVYNDFNSLNILIEKITDIHKQNKISFVIVNDNSYEKELASFKPHKNSDIKIIHLVKNMGHQRAIAIGLSYIFENMVSDYVIVMDSDGEDKPEHIQRLLEKAEKNKIVFARRSKRNESLAYKFMYYSYKFCFNLLTGKTISFGNYCVIPFSKLKNIVHLPEIWIHFSGGIIASKIPYSTVPLEKGNRYEGKTKMNLTSLIIHGLSAIAVHVETLIVRLLVFSVSLIVLSLLGILIILSIKLFSDLAIPGWATTSVLELFTIFIQAFFMSLLFIFFILNRRAQKNLIPLLEYNKYIDKVQIFNE